MKYRDIPVGKCFSRVFYPEIIWMKVPNFQRHEVDGFEKCICIKAYDGTQTVPQVVDVQIDDKANYEIRDLT